MAYTKSIDGTMRCNVNLKLRFTKEDIREIKRMIAIMGGDPNDWRGYLKSHLLDFIWLTLPELAEYYEND